MTFISYAQNLEDVMLYRALRHLERGFYIDVGACHPVNDSVTKAFYERGWRGINIEPNPEYFRSIQQDRPEDINLNVAVAAHQGEVLFYEVLKDPGASTVNKAYADRYAEAGHEVRACTVPCTTLDAICVEHKVDNVHFLKIDVEGAERTVLEGFTFTQVRPWIVVIEANEPYSTQDVSREWEALILDKGYTLVYCDGLNRFYLAEERADLQARFRVPPNWFDHYIVYPHWSAKQELSRVGAALEETTAERDRLRYESGVLREQNERLGGVATQLETASRQIAGVEHHAAELREDLARLRDSQQRQTAQIAELLRQADEDRGRWLQALERSEADRRRLTQLEAALDEKENQRQQLEARYSELRTRVQEFEAKVSDLHGQIHHWWTVADGLDKELHLVYTSRSWRITRPLRVTKHMLLRVVHSTRAAFLAARQWGKGLIKGTLHIAIRVVSGHPTLKSTTVRLVKRFPRLEQRLRTLVQPPPASPPPVAFVVTVPEPTSRAEEIYQDLKRLMENTKR